MEFVQGQLSMVASMAIGVVIGLLVYSVQTRIIAKRIEKRFNETNAESK